MNFNELFSKIDEFSDHEHDKHDEEQNITFDYSQIVKKPKRVSWSKLTPALKIDIICKYVDKLFKYEIITLNEKIELKCFLIDAVYNKIICKNVDVEYDYKTYELINVKKLTKSSFDRFCFGNENEKYRYTNVVSS